MIKMITVTVLKMTVIMMRTIIIMRMRNIALTLKQKGESVEGGGGSGRRVGDGDGS